VQVIKKIKGGMKMQKIFTNEYVKITLENIELYKYGNDLVDMIEKNLDNICDYHDEYLSDFVLYGIDKIADKYLPKNIDDIEDEFFKLKSSRIEEIMGFDGIEEEDVRDCMVEIVRRSILWDIEEEGFNLFYGAVEEL
jgi:hypothetical protein